MQAILVAREPSEREVWTFVLRHAGLSVASALSLQRIVDKWLEHPADLIIIFHHTDDKLQSAIEGLRAITQVPLLLIADSPSETQVCTWLEKGADLVLTRPVAPRILAQYALTLLRRARAVATFAFPKLELEDIRLNPATRTVKVSGRDAQRLTQLEFRLLYMLMVNRGQVLPTETIIERVWGYTGDGNRELLRGLISRLRRKIEPDPHQPRFIHTIPATGYSFSLEIDV